MRLGVVGEVKRNRNETLQIVSVVISGSSTSTRAGGPIRQRNIHVGEYPNDHHAPLCRSCGSMGTASKIEGGGEGGGGDPSRRVHRATASTIHHPEAPRRAHAASAHARRPAFAFTIHAAYGYLASYPTSNALSPTPPYREGQLGVEAETRDRHSPFAKSQIGLNCM